MADRVIQRNDTAARWQSINPILATGEIGIEIDGAKGYKIGDGKTPWNSLPYPGNPASIVQDLGNNENAVPSQKLVTEKLSELGSKLWMNYKETFDVTYKPVSTSISVYRKGAKIVNRGILLLFSEDKNYTGRQDVKKDETIVLNSDKTYVQTGNNTGVVDFDYYPPLSWEQDEKLSEQLEKLKDDVIDKFISVESKYDGLSNFTFKNIYEAQYAKVVTKTSVYRKGAKIVNRGIRLLIADKSDMSGRIDIYQGDSVILDSDKLYLQTANSVGEVDFDYIVYTDQEKERLLEEEINKPIDGERVLDKTIHPQATTFFDASKNLYNGISVYGAYLEGNGEIAELSSSAISEYIPFKEGNLIVSVNGVVPSGGYCHCLYDAEHNFVKSVSSNNGFVSWEEGVAYARFSLPKYQNGKIQIEKGTEFTGYEEPFVRIKPEYIDVDVKIETISSLVGLPSASISKEGLSNEDGRLYIDSLPKYIKGYIYLTLKADLQSLDSNGGVVVGFADGDTSIKQLLLKVDSSKVYLGLYNQSADYDYYYSSVDHGLQVSSYITISCELELDKINIVLLSASGVFKHQFDVGDDIERYGKPFVKVLDSTILSNVKLNGGSKKYQKPIWVVGDSYTSLYKQRWTYQMMVNCGITEFNLIGLAGGTSTQLLEDLKKALIFGTPTYLVWALGMNDEFASWKINVEELIGICNAKGINLILCTIPTVPSRNKEEISDYVRNSEHRYIDFYDAVKANSVGAWLDGCLSEDGVHPTEKGAVVLCGQVLCDLPEIAQYK